MKPGKFLEKGFQRTDEKNSFHQRLRGKQLTCTGNLLVVCLTSAHLGSNR